MQFDDYHWFCDHFDALYQKYGECYLAIQDCRVIGVFANFDSAVREMDSVVQPGSYIVQKVCRNIEDTYVHIATPFYMTNSQSEDV